MLNSKPPEGSIRTIRIDIQYEGTNYVGWQRQPDGVSVQKLVEEAMSKIADEKVDVVGTSRTDSGVHARQQVASFCLKKKGPSPYGFMRGANTLLPSDIRVVRAEEMDLSFLARRDAKEKTYRYYIQMGPEPLVFLRNFSWHIREPLDLDRMRRATSDLLGTHDFSSFRSASAQTRTSERTIFQAEWKIGEFEMLYFEITANGFLKQMVRTIVGTLVEVGEGKRAPEEMKTILEAKNRTTAGLTAPPHGLFLWRVTF